MSCNHYKLLLDQPEPDFDVLLSRLSQYAFTRLSARDQQLQVEKIRQYVNEVEVQGNEESDEALRLRSTFSELLKKLPYSAQLDLFLSKVMHKLKWEQLISSFKQLEVDHQKQVIWKSRVHLASVDGKTEEDFRLGIFTQELCNYDFHYVHNLLIKYSNREDDEHEATSTFSELLKKVPYFHQLYLFLYKVIRSANYWRNPIPVILFGRKLKISDDIEKLPEENEEDFRLRRFTESFKRLRIRYREEIIQYIAEGLFRDLGYYQYPGLFRDPMGQRMGQPLARAQNPFASE